MRNKRAGVFPSSPCTTQILGKNAAAARPGRKTRTPVPQNSASHQSNTRTSDADADATGQLDILDADDILESDDISALEAAAAGIVSFEVAPTPEPSGFEIGDVGEFDHVEVEGEGEIEAPPPSLSTLFGIKAKPAPIKVVAAEIPPAPVTSPIPLETVVAQAAAPAPAPGPEPEVEAAPVSRSEPIAERTLEIKRVDLAFAATKLEAEERAAQDAPGHTEVLVRSAMPLAIRTMHGGAQAPTRRPSSIAPVALDIAAAPAAPRATMPSVPAFPPPARMPSYASMTPKRGLSGVAIGALAFSALALVGLVGIGGYAASRAFSDKPEAASAASAPESSEASGLPGDLGPSGVVVAPASPNASPGNVGGGVAIDVSALPTAPVPGAAPRTFTGRSAAPSAPAGAPLAAAGPAATPVSRTSSGGALPPPGGGKVASAPLAAPGAPLPPPPAAAAPAPAAPAPVSSTGTVRVDPSLRAVVIDGNFRRATDGVVVVSCGSHRVKVGMKGEQTVNVPCGGSVSL